MNIYFAGAIRGGRDDQALYFEIVSMLKLYGHVHTEHVGDPHLSASGEAGDDDRRIHDRDLAWLKSSDYLVAEVTTPSLGVGYEIGKATECGTPVLCLFRPGGGRALSAMVAGSPAVSVREYDGAVDLKPIFDEFFAR
jgi:2'-deoxynucleoside 5'-phosphate N-hydrolase